MEKKLLFLLAILYSATIFSQVSIVKDVTSSLKPTSATQNEWNNNKWNGKLFYKSASPNNLCVTDGTSAGTISISNLNGGTLMAVLPAQDFVYIFSSVITFSPTISNTLTIWKSDGTASGTTVLKTFDAASLSTSPQYFSVSGHSQNYSIDGNVIYFSAFTSANGLELWKSDGTVSGTVMVKDINVGTASSNPAGFCKINGNIIFKASDASNPNKLWSSDGTEAGTQQIPVAEPFFFVNGDMVRLGNKVIFFAHNTIDGYEPYVSDGTATGTFMLKNLNSAGNSLTSQAQGMHLKVANNFAFMSLFDGVYRTDGTTAGTIKLTSEMNNISDTDYSNFDANKIWFINYNSAGSGANSKLIVSDGTIEGTSTIVTNLSYPQKIKIYNSSAWFQSRDTGSSANAEVWKSDGIASNTNLALDISSAGYSSNPYGFFELNGKLYFWGAYNFNNNHALFQYNPDYTFNGSVNNNWTNNSNWNSGLKPISTDNATIPSGKNVIIDANAYVKDLFINSPINLSAGNLDVYGSMILIGGNKVTLNNNNLNLKQNATLQTGSNLDYIVTNGTGSLSKENFSGTYGFPIGTLSNYNPIVFSNSGTPDTFSFRVSDGNTSTNPSVNTTWEISEAVSGGSNANISFSWNQSQENSGFVRNSAKVGHFVGGTWVQENSGTVSGTDPYTVSAIGISSFSPFSIMNFSTLGNVDFSKSKIQIYPNPFNENLNISTQENGVVYFYDALGKLVSTSLLMKGSNSLNQSTLQKGVYIYQIKNTNGEIVTTGKLIKK